jgi:hypothetical protein
MHIIKHFSRGLGFGALAALGFTSCQKEGALPAAPVSNSVKPELTVGLPPAITWWARLGVIPYTDGIPGDKPILNQYPQGFAINGKGFVCGALVTSSIETDITSRDLWQFDPPTTSWIAKSPYPGGLGDLIASTSFVIGDNAYLVAGNKTWQYNQPTDTWTQKASVSSITGRFGGSSFAINGKGYLGLGWNSDAPGESIVDVNDWWQYDPVSDHWTAMHNFPGAKRLGAGGFAIDGKGYIVSGEPQSKVDANTVWQYDPGTDHWTQKADFPGPAVELPVATNGTINGLDVGFIVNTGTWEYNPSKDSWGQIANMPGGGRYQAAGFVIGKSLIIANLDVIALNWTK